jgi:hypothetical protein
VIEVRYFTANEREQVRFLHAPLAWGVGVLVASQNTELTYFSEHSASREA